MRLAEDFRSIEWEMEDCSISGISSNAVRCCRRYGTESENKY